MLEGEGDRKAQRVRRQFLGESVLFSSFLCLHARTDFATAGGKSEESPNAALASLGDRSFLIKFNRWLI